MSPSNERKNYNLSLVMDTWTKQQLYPILKVTRDYSSGRVTVSQENINTVDKSKWWIPLTYTVQTEPNFSNTMPKAWLKPQSHNLTLDQLYQKDEWIIFNLQQTGVYHRSIFVYYNHFIIMIIKYISGLKKYSIWLKNIPRY